MNPATRTETAPGKNQVSTEITTPNREHQKLAGRVMKILSDHMPLAKHHQVEPITAETPVSVSPELNAVGAELIGSAEPIIDTTHIADIAGKTAVHAINTVTGNEGLLVHGEIASGHKATSKFKEMVLRKLHLKKAT
ncbi:hypothetical protein HYU94_01410 [Candidatus Daviesbacteria bacterium]|nr:hypothetical protein [Candidatus Daviesbacteria bacterium]